MFTIDGIGRWNKMEQNRIKTFVPLIVKIESNKNSNSNKFLWHWEEREMK